MHIAHLPTCSEYMLMYATGAPNGHTQLQY